MTSAPSIRQQHELEPSHRAVLTTARADLEHLATFLPASSQIYNSLPEKSSAGHLRLADPTHHEEIQQQIYQRCRVLSDDDTNDATTPVQWSFRAHRRLEALMTVARYSETFENLLRLTRFNGVTLKPGNITLEFFTSGKGRTSFWQLEESLKTTGGFTPAKARSLINRSIMVHTYAPQILDALLAGTLTMSRFETIMQQLERMHMPRHPGSKATDEQLTEFTEQTVDIDIARRKLTQALLERNDAHVSSGENEEHETASPEFDDDPEAASQREKDQVEADKDFAKDARSPHDMHHPHSAAQRVAAALKRRYVVIDEQADAMAYLKMFMPQLAAHQIDARLNAAVRSIRARNLAQGRTRQQIRADVMMAYIVLGMRAATRGKQNDASPDAEASTNSSYSGSALPELTDYQRELLEAAELPTEILAADAHETQGARGEDAGNTPTNAQADEDGEDFESAVGEGDVVADNESSAQLEALADPTASSGLLPGSALHLVMMLTLEQYLGLGGCVSPDLLPVLEEIDPDLAKLSRRNQDFHLTQAKTGAQDPPDWLDEIDQGFHIDGMSEPLTPHQAYRLTRETEKLTAVLTTEVG